jgi:L-2-hydroxyglutarate oxidase LhgO
VVATDPSEIAALDELERRGRANGLLDMRRIDGREIRDIEPQVIGIAALHVPDSGVADFPAIARHLARALERRGATIATGRAVTAIQENESAVTISTETDPISAKLLVNCAGLQSDLVARMAGLQPSVRIVPFRGEYYRLADSANDLVRSLVYPVPDPRFPFLGVHFTRRIDGAVEVGPNAVLALGREHYRGAPADWAGLTSTLRYRGFRRLAGRHWLAGSRELVNSRSKRLYARSARKLVPALAAGDLIAGGAGVRAQAVDEDGNLLDDFVIENVGRTVHVLNAPSPGATSSLAIGRYISAQVGAIFGG